MKLEPTGDVSQETDEELIRLVCLGQRELFAHLLGRYERRVYHIVQGILNNPADSEEVLQESFLKAFQHLAEFRGESQFPTWLTRIAINEARMRLRKYRTKLYDSIDEPREDEMDLRPRELRDWEPNPEERLAKAEMASLLEKAIRALPIIYREALILRDVDHLSTEEAALALGISVSAAKARLFRARIMVRDYLAPHFEKRWHHRLVDRFTQRRRRP